MSRCGEMAKIRIGDVLVESGMISKDQLAEALNIQKKSSKKVGEILIDLGYINEKQIIEVLEFHLGIPHVQLERFYISSDITSLISENIANRHQLIPVKREKNRLTVAMVDPLNFFAIDDVKIATGLEVIPVIATSKDIKNAIDQYYGKQHAQKAIDDIKEQYDITDISELNEEVLNEVSNAPVVRLVNSIVQQAVMAKASDIHIEPFENTVRIRFRVDGDLREIMSSEKSTHSAITTRIKIMAKMDIAERRIPQDGRIEMSVDEREIDLRISVLPTVHGEKVVIRLLDRSNFLIEKSQLGFSVENLKLYEKMMKTINGIILVTGPTGSGKSTTLYTMLQEYNQINTNIVTVEDPVEYRLHGINQVQVNSKAGLTFANGLRSILRQDPDIVMIGEIRDTETAQIAMRAAITGHIVLSTMHTNDTVSTVTRLVDMGIENYLVASALSGVISQRLVKRICNHCKISYEPTPQEMATLNMKEPQPLYKGKGCTVCNFTGYKGRVAVHEMLPIGSEIKSLIEKGAPLEALSDKAESQGLVPLIDNCRQLALDGITTVNELIRVAYTLD